MGLNFSPISLQPGVYYGVSMRNDIRLENNIATRDVTLRSTMELKNSVFSFLLPAMSRSVKDTIIPTPFETN